MTAIIIPRKWTQQPRGAVNLSDCFGRPLFGYVPTNPSRDVSGNSCPIFQDTSSRVVTEHGIAATFSSGKWISYDSTKAGGGANDTNPVTYVYIVKYGAQGYQWLTHFNNSRSAQILGHGWITANLNCNDSSKTIITGTETGKIYVIAISANIYGATSNSWINGINTNSWNNTDAKTGSLVYIGRRTVSDSEWFTGGLLGTYTINGILDNSVIQELAKNPWQTFKRDPQRIYFDVAGAGGSTTYTTTTSLNAAIQQAKSATVSVNGAIQQAKSANASVNTAIQQSHTSTTILNTAVIQAKTTSTSVNSAIQQAFTASANLEAAIQVSNTATASINGYIQAGNAVSANLSAAILQARSAVSSLDAGISASHTASASANGAISQSRTTTVSLSGAIRQARSAAASLNAALLQARSATAAINGYVLVNTQVFCTLNTAIQATHTAFASLNGYIDTAVSLPAVDINSWIKRDSIYNLWVKEEVIANSWVR